MKKIINKISSVFLKHNLLLAWDLLLFDPRAIATIVKNKKSEMKFALWTIGIWSLLNVLLMLFQSNIFDSLLYGVAVLLLMTVLVFAIFMLIWWFFSLFARLYGGRGRHLDLIRVMGYSLVVPIILSLIVIMSIFGLLPVVFGIVWLLIWVLWTVWNIVLVSYIMMAVHKLSIPRTIFVMLTPPAILLVLVAVTAVSVVSLGLIDDPALTLPDSVIESSS